MCFANIFAQSESCPFICINSAFQRTQVFDFDKVQFIYFSLIVCFLCFILKIKNSNPQVLSFRNFKVLGFRFRFYVYEPL